MPSTAVETIEQLTLDGPLRPFVAIALAVVLLCVFAWSLWRERTILGRRNTALFWILRATALLVVIWMLLAPANHRVEKSTTRRTIAIMTDVSGSMRTVDPAGTADEFRWAASVSPSNEFAVIRAADAAIVASGIAQQHIARAAEGLRQNQPERDVIEATMMAAEALQRTEEHLRRVHEMSVGGTQASAERVLRILESSEFKDFQSLSVAFEKGRSPAQKGWRESFSDLEFRVGGVRRSLHELGRRIVADESAMAANQNPQLLASVSELARIGRAANLVESLDRDILRQVRQQAGVRFSSFDSEVTRLSDAQQLRGSLSARRSTEEEPSTSPGGTDLAAGLERLHREAQEESIAAVFLITDAAHNADESDPRDVAATLDGTPVYVVPIGNTNHVRDIRVQSVSAPAVAMRNDDIVIEATLQAHDCTNEVCTVQLLQDGETIDFRELVFDSSFATRTVRFEHRVSSVGRQQFQLAVPALDGELTEQNNYQEVDVEVTRSNIQILLADELPRWEYRYLTQLFRRDDKVVCDELLFHPRMIATGRREESKSFPVTVDQWDQYDVVLLGDLPPEHLPVASQESLVQYLKQRGGTLVLIAGQESMPHAYLDHPLRGILPVTKVDETAKVGDAGYAFQVTEEGQKHHALMIGETEEATRTAWDFVNRYSPLPAVSDWRRPLPLARTLIAAVPRGSAFEPSDQHESAFLCWQPVGRGRVVYLAGPDTYRLRFLRGDRLHYRFWGQLLRWAIASDLTTGSQFVRIRTDKSRYRPDETIRITVRLSDADGEPVVADRLETVLISQDKPYTFPLVADAEIPGEYHADARPLPPGVYRVEPAGPAIEQLQQESEQGPAYTSVTVQADLPMELVDTRSDRALAQQIADVTGGQVLAPTAVEEVLRLTNLEPIVTESVERRPLWLQWKYLWLVFGCLQIEWIIRKWKGLS